VHSLLLESVFDPIFLLGSSKVSQLQSCNEIAEFWGNTPGNVHRHRAQFGNAILCRNGCDGKARVAE
jgi:hypothetical protein